MRKYILSSFFICGFIVSYAQQSKTSLLYDFVIERSQSSTIINVDNLFSRATHAKNVRPETVVSEKLILSLDRTVGGNIYRDKPHRISLAIPSLNGQTYRLELVQQDINSNAEFSFGTLEGNGLAKKTGNEQGLHYRGYIKGDPLSIASFSFFSNADVTGLFCNEDGNFNLGKYGNDGTYLLYNSKSLLNPPHFICATSEVPAPVSRYNKDPQKTVVPSNIIPPLLCKKVRLYWEADYKLYSNNFASNLNTTVNYMTALFNQVAVMYQNEGIIIELAETYTWITPDPYNTATSSNGLDDFQFRWNTLGDSFNADLAMLLDGAPTNNGGVAYLLTDELCNRAYAYGYANIYGNFNEVPAYSWDVEVVTHEMGHLVGSHHTQWCGWNTGFGNTCGAIDNCVTTESYNSCTSCGATTNTNPSAPLGFKGTVMSYCHLRSGIGINLAYGFGPLPQAVIRNTVDNAGCLLNEIRWTGALSTAWEDPANWGCGMIPDITTDVNIPGGLLNYPVVNSAAVCRRLTEAEGTSVLVRTGFTLLVAGQ